MIRKANMSSANLAKSWNENQKGLMQATETLNLLSSPARLQILCHLLENDELTVGTLLERVDLSQSALSQHLAKLRGMGLVETRKEQQRVYYRIARQDIQKLIGVLHELYCKVR